MTEKDERPGGARDEQMWPMGAVTRRTGIGEHTLRAWERRFGFPRPRRLPSGHRRYTSEQVRQLALIALALEHGYRASDVVPLERDALEALLEECGAFDRVGVGDARSWIAEALDATRHLDRERLDSLLSREAFALGVPTFLRDRVAPLLDELGAAWTRGDLEIRHEHFCSDVIEGRLRVLRLPLEPGAAEPPLLLACLPGERHALGLQLVALTAAVAGRSARLLGADIPCTEIARAAEEVDAVAVAVSISLYAPEEDTRRSVAELRGLLPGRIPLWIGGEGAAALGRLPAGVVLVDDLDGLAKRLAELAA